MWREEVRKWGLRPWLYWLNAGFLYSTFFLTVSQVKKKLGWGKKLALKIWNGRHFVRFTCFLFCSSEKFGQQIFLWRFHEIFFLPFLLPKFSVAQPSPLHTQKTAVRVRRKKWTALCFSQLFSAEVYTRASRSENIHKHMLFICTLKSRLCYLWSWITLGHSPSIWVILHVYDGGLIFMK